MRGIKEKLSRKIRIVKLLILDCDGVLTDGSIIYDDKGIEIKAFNVRDGHGITLLKNMGIKCAVITARKSGALEKRVKELSIDYLYQGARDKVRAYKEILEKTGFTPRETAYVGDDVVDLPLIKRVGFSAAVLDAVKEVKDQADYVTKTPGGKGAVREIAEIILKAKGLWEGLIEDYMR